MGSRSWIVVGLICASVFLSGCTTSRLSNDEVVQRSARALSGLHSFHYQADLELNGNLPTNLVEGLTWAHVRTTGDIDSKNLASPKFTLVSQIEATAQTGPVSIAGQVIGLAEETYFQLTDLALPNLLPISLGADSRWYKIRHPNGNGEADRLGIETIEELTSDQLAEIRETIASQPLFKIIEAYPDETVGGQRSYHYQVQLAPDNLKSVVERLTQTMRLAGLHLNTDAWNDYVFDIWINKRNFQITRIQVTDVYLNNGVPISFQLDCVLTRHNDNPSITAPAVSEELNSKSALFLPGLGI